MQLNKVFVGLNKLFNDLCNSDYMIEVFQHISTLYYVTIAREIKIYIRKLLTLIIISSFSTSLIMQFRGFVKWCQKQTKENVIDNLLTD